MSLLIKNATIVHADKIESSPKDILLDKGKIVKIAASIKEEAKVKIDAKGKYVLPGLIDIHVHFRQPGREDKENIETGSKAAAKGGFTTVMCMPNTHPVIDNGLIVEALIKESNRLGICNVIPIGAITRGQNDQELTDMFELKEAGCLALSDDGKSVLNSQLMRMALQYSKMTGLLLLEHCQDFLLTSGGLMNEGEVSTMIGLKGDPGIAETVIVGRDIELANYLDTRVHLCHMSLRRSVELIRQAKKQGIKVTAEATPHHFSLTDEAVKTYSTNTKVNPPLRTADDVEAIKEGLKDGTIDCIVTDHAPHTKEDKEVDFEQAPYGMIGLETSLGLTVRELVEPGILSWPQLVEKMSTNPAKLIGLVNKGMIKEDADADITIVDPNKEWIFKEEEIASKSKNSPFIGWKLKSSVEYTILGGKVVYKSGS